MFGFKHSDGLSFYGVKSNALVSSAADLDHYFLFVNSFHDNTQVSIFLVIANTCRMLYLIHSNS